jgi:hypothetical protein
VSKFTTVVSYILYNPAQDHLSLSPQRPVKNLSLKQIYRSSTLHLVLVTSYIPEIRKVERGMECGEGEEAKEG